MESIESRAKVKSLLLDILAECDPSFSDILIKRIHPIVKQLVENEFAEQKNKLLLEVAVMIGQIMGAGANPLWESKPEHFGLTSKELNNHMMGR